MNLSRQPDNLFFSTPFWLPPNVTWDFFERFDTGDGFQFPSVKDLYAAWKLVPLFLIAKYGVEKYVGPKVGAWAGIQDEERKKPPHVDLLEKAHRSKPWGKWSDNEISALTKQLDWTEEQIREWFKARRKFALPTTLEKFSESFWRCFGFIFILAYGLYVHWSKDWFWDIKLAFKDYPQPVTRDMYWYFLISLANYSAWNISQFWDVPRKDPKLLMLHHFAAVFLLSASWIAGAHRIGLYTLLIHDVGDVLVEGSKSLKYIDALKVDQPSLYFFSLFSTSLWVFTRNFILPLRIIPCVYYHAPFSIPETFPLSCLHGPCDISSFRFNMCHIILIILGGMSTLHLYWTYIIMKINYTAFFAGKLKDDTHTMSDDDEDDSAKKITPKKESWSVRTNG
nr:PREDICTED: ceramide synthase 6-like isoform X1 [Bemisia tabaci]XP_018905666.1 PREDICTED: ceramide synthase 6-like isoform X1 [Bemisia tabaci]